MNITFDELRKIKHQLPHGSIARIASELGREEQQVRDFFGANAFKGATTDWHYEPGGAEGGIVSVADTAILEAAQRIINEQSRQN